MPYPSPPEILTSYTAQEQALGDGTFPGQEIDVDLASVRQSITAIIEFLKVFTRSDGQLANGSVTSDTLGASLIIGFDPPAPWATGQAYTTRSTVFEGFGFYLCTTAHTSGTFATDLASGRWVLLADLTPPGGALIASNNFSDVPDKPTARATLGLGTMATANSGTGASDHRTNLQNEAFFQPLAASLTSWAALTRASGFDTFAATPSSANLRALLTDESGSGALLFAGGAMGTPSSLVLTNATGLTTSGIAAGSLTTSSETIAANNSDTQVPTSAAVKSYVDPLTSAVETNFSAISASGTYSRTGTLVTVTLTAHGMSTGHWVTLDFTTGTATDGWYQVTVVDANTFTVVDSASGATSGNVTRQIWARRARGVTSIVDSGAGDHTVNFAAATDANFSVFTTVANGVGDNWTCNPHTRTTTSVQLRVANGTNILSDASFVNVMVMR